MPSSEKSSGAITDLYHGDKAPEVLEVHVQGLDQVSVVVLHLLLKVLDKLTVLHPKKKNTHYNKVREKNTQHKKIFTTGNGTAGGFRVATDYDWLLYKGMNEIHFFLFVKEFFVPNTLSRLVESKKDRSQYVRIVCPLFCPLFSLTSPSKVCRRNTRQSNHMSDHVRQ